MKSKTLNRTVVILGAGVAGLTAAVHLAAAGHKPLLLEAAKVPGGRARSYFDRALDEELDNGPHLLMGTYQHTLALLSQLGTRHCLWEEEATAFTFWDRTLAWHTLACPAWPAPWHLLAALFRFPGFSARDKVAVLRLGLDLLRDHDALEKQSVTQWLHSHRQTEALFSRLWQPLCLATLNEAPGSANAALFATVLKRLFLTDRNASRPLLPTVPLSYLLALPAQRFIQEAGGEIRYRCRVQGLEVSGDILRAIHTSDGTLHHPKAVISALPHHALSPLLPKGMVQTNLGHTPIVSVHLTYPRPLHLPAAMVGVPQEASQWLFDRGRLQKNITTGGRFSAVLSASYRECTWSREKLITTVHQDLARVLPALVSVEPCAARVIKEHRATFAAWPGTTSQRAKTETPWHNFFLAGDWTSTGLPATLEGAVQSGVQAVQKTLDWGSRGVTPLAGPGRSPGGVWGEAPQKNKKTESQQNGISHVLASQNTTRKSQKVHRHSPPSPPPAKRMQ